MKNKLKLLIIGGGMYVTGKGTDNFGTIFPGIFKASNRINIGEVILAVTNPKSAKYAKSKFKKLNKIFNTDIKFKSFPEKKQSNIEYKKVAIKYKPDAAIICVPDHLHYEITSFLLKCKIHCLVVKPLTDNIIHAKKLNYLANKNKVLGLVEFHKRLDEANLIIKNKLQNGDIGSLLYSVIEYSQKILIPTKIFKSWANRTNVFQYLGVHYVDLIYFLTNYRPIKVQAWGQKEVLQKLKINTWDSIQVIIEWKKPNGKKFVSNHITNWIESNNASAMSDQKISIIGETGKLISDQKNRGLQIINDKNKIQDINPYFSSFNILSKNKDDIFFGYGIKSVSNFINNVESIINKNINYKIFLKNNSSFKESLISTAVIEAVNKSLITNKSQKVRL